MAATGRVGASSTSTGMADLKYRLLFVFLAIVVFRIGSYIPVPGLNPMRLQELFNGQQNNIVGLFNMFSGGALMRFSIFDWYHALYLGFHCVQYFQPSQLYPRKERESDEN